MESDPVLSQAFVALFTTRGRACISNYNEITTVVVFLMAAHCTWRNDHNYSITLHQLLSNSFCILYLYFCFLSSVSSAVQFCALACKRPQTSLGSSSPQISCFRACWIMKDYENRRKKHKLNKLNQCTRPWGGPWLQHTVPASTCDWGRQWRSSCQLVSQTSTAACLPEQCGVQSGDRDSHFQSEGQLGRKIFATLLNKYH